jgi:ParB family chromosome partitioning protein
MAQKKRGLGRGLDALLGSKESTAKAADAAAGADTLQQLDIERIQPGQYQPRSAMDAAKLRELADSIKQQGIVQPIVVRPCGQDKYEIIAGERRWRAAQIAELSQVPVVIKDVDDRQTIAMALIENIQREDLNPLEEAAALQRLIKEFEITHQQAAEAVGRSRAAVSNLLRLLELHDTVKEYVDDKALDMGHARCLLALERGEQPAAAAEIIRKGLNVRQAEALVKQWHKRHENKAPQRKNADISNLEQRLSEQLCTKVVVNHTSAGKGKLIIHYHSPDELDGILERIK